MTVVPHGKKHENTELLLPAYAPWHLTQHTGKAPLPTSFPSMLEDAGKILDIILMRLTSMRSVMQISGTLLQF